MIDRYLCTVYHRISHRDMQYSRCGYNGICTLVKFLAHSGLGKRERRDVNIFKNDLSHLRKFPKTSAILKTESGLEKIELK
jgi:hypothetical protein